MSLNIGFVKIINFSFVHKMEYFRVVNKMLRHADCGLYIKSIFSSYLFVFGS